MPFEIGDRVVLSEVGYQGNSLGRDDEGVITEYEGDRQCYPWRVAWDSGDADVYSTKELENLETKVAPKSKQSGFAKFMNQIESGGVPCEV